MNTKSTEVVIDTDGKIIDPWDIDLDIDDHDFSYFNQIFRPSTKRNAQMTDKPGRRKVNLLPFRPTLDPDLPFRQQQDVYVGDLLRNKYTWLAFFIIFLLG